MFEGENVHFDVCLFKTVNFYLLVDISNLIAKTQKKCDPKLYMTISMPRIW